MLGVFAQFERAIIVERVLIPQRQVVSAEIALERGGVSDLSPWESPAAAAQRVDAAVHGITVNKYGLFS